jgi:cell division protein FtsQ
MVAKEPMSARLPKANFGSQAPVLAGAAGGAGFGAYEGAQRLMPYADRPITKIACRAT